MPVPSYLIDRISNSQLSGLRVAELLGNLSVAIDNLGMPGGTLTLDFADGNDPVQPGDLIPTIQLTLRRVRQPDAPSQVREEAGKDREEAGKDREEAGEEAGPPNPEARLEDPYPAE
jgi:hypothetical protein